MTEREHLIDLLEQEKAFPRNITDDERRERLADFLLEHSVIVLPCKVGSTVYKVNYNHCCTCPDLDYYSIAEKSFNLNMLNDIGKTVFLTHEKAEQALKERKQK